MSEKTETPQDTAHLSSAKRALLEQYLRGGDGKPSAPSGVVPHPGKLAPISLAQSELWHRELQVPEIPPLYNECIMISMSGPIDVAALEKAFTEVIRRHEAWRTTFETVGGDIVQIVHSDVTIRLLEVDLRSIPREEREAEAYGRIAEDTRRPFDMRNGPLLRPTLVRMEESEHRLYLVIHQIIVDGMSAYQIFPSELAALYCAFTEGNPSPLPAPPVQFGDFALWQREPPQAAERANQLEYWRQQLGCDPPVLQWPSGILRPPMRSFHGVIRPFSFPQKLSTDIRELSRREGSTLFLTLLTGFAALLHQYTEQDDFVLGTLAPSGRSRSELLGLLGYFLNPVALRFNLKNQPTFIALMREAQRITYEAMSHHDVPMQTLESELRVRTDPSRSPFFTVAISLQPPTPELGLPWSVTSMDVESGGSCWDLYLAFIDRPTGIIGRVQYNPDLFEQSTIFLLLEDLQHLLELACANPFQTVAA